MVDTMGRIFNSIVRKFLKTIKIGGTNSLMYRHQNEQISGLSSKLTSRCKNLSRLLISSNNTSFDLDMDDNYFLMVQLCYTTFNKKKIYFKEEGFFFAVLNNLYQLSLNLPAAKVSNTKIVLMNFFPKRKGAEHTDGSNSETAVDTPSIELVLKFEENSMNLFESIKDKIDRINILEVFSIYFLMMVFPPHYSLWKFNC
jgi:hypothetical protein